MYALLYPVCSQQKQTVQIRTNRYWRNQSGRCLVGLGSADQMIIDRAASRSRGDNTFGSVRPSVRLSVCLFIRESSSQGAFKMVGRSKLLLFRQVAPSRSITLLIISSDGIFLQYIAGDSGNQLSSYGQDCQRK